MNISSRITHQVGLVFGKFYPLHCGHIYLIEKAVRQVDELHIFLGCEHQRDLKLFTDSNMPRQPQVKDRYSWLQKTFKDRHNIHIHLLDEVGIASYPNGWQEWSDRVKAILSQYQIVPTTIFTSEPQDIAEYQHHFQADVKLVDAKREFLDISATKIRQTPYKNWQYIAKKAQPFFIKRIAIIGNTHFTKLPKQLANIYNTEFVLNGYVNYIHYCQHDKMALALNESDYIRMAMLHAERMDKAALSANKVLFSSLDFQTLHQCYQKKFQSDCEVLQELENHYPFDLVIKESDFDKHDSEVTIFENVLKMVEKQLD